MSGTELEPAWTCCVHGRMSLVSPWAAQTRDSECSQQGEHSESGVAPAWTRGARGGMRLNEYVVGAGSYRSRWDGFG